MGKDGSDETATTSQRLASTEGQKFWVLHLAHSKGCRTMLSHTQLVGWLYGQKFYWRFSYRLLKMNINGASTIFGVASCTIYGLWNIVIPYSPYRLPLLGRMIVMISLTLPKNERQWSITDFWFCILHTLRAMERCYSIFNISAAFMGNNASEDIVSASYNSAPTEHQQFLWGLNMLHSNELHCVVPELSLTQSVFTICCCIQLR